MTGTEDLHRPILEGEGATDYERYLRTDELLSLQRRPEEQAHHDELLFQTVHQTSELWLKFATTEVEKAASHMDQGELDSAQRLLRRAVLSIEYITTQLDMLNQIAAWDYLGFRVALGHGAGFDSRGFRVVPHVTQQVASTFDRVLERAGVELLDIYRHNREHEQLFGLAELLTDWDERLSLWRSRHYLAVARALGEDTMGIQGVPVQVLTKLVTQRQLPRLWEARSRLTETFDAQREAQRPST